jgi:protein-tyrosine phosphatase
VIDVHSHVLPGIDDGPRTTQDALALARAAVAAGTTELVATPHVSWEFQTPSQVMRDGVVAMQAELDAAGVPLRLRTGAEVALTRAADLDDEELRALRLGGGEWLLAESPLTMAAPGLDLLLQRLQAQGHRVLLAHPERAPEFQRHPEMLERLVDAGMLTQITAGSLVGRFGSTVQRFTFDMVAAGLVHNVASDAHNADRRPPGLLAEIEQADAELPGLIDHAEWLCEQVPRAILDGGAIPPAPGPAPQRKRRRLFGGARRG